ncbi:MAG TPA: hypothetical protein VL981_13810 [Candidatus Methylacidiphilales bacterium]|nr:hypothetical protein [Candidatus Methylacidiphilales bacterium]
MIAIGLIGLVGCCDEHPASATTYQQSSYESATTDNKNMQPVH